MRQAFLMSRCSVLVEVWLSVDSLIANEIQDSYSDFGSGDIVKGISSILQSGLKALLRTVSANSSSVTK